MRIDYLVVIDFFEKMSAIVGKEKMEYFNDISVYAFIFEPIGLSISQHLIIRSMGILLYHDCESSKQIYQLAMDEKQDVNN